MGNNIDDNQFPKKERTTQCRRDTESLLNSVDSLCTIQSRTAVLLEVGCYVLICLDDNPSGIAVEIRRGWAFARGMSFFKHPFSRLPDDVGANDQVKLIRHSVHDLMLCSPFGRLSTLNPHFLSTLTIDS